MVPTILKEWREPRHDAFEQRNVWSLFNAFTEAMKEGDLAYLPKKTEALHALMDSHVGLAFGRNRSDQKEKGKGLQRRFIRFCRPFSFSLQIVR